jgi:RNA polymerase sigma-70 factor, ECF subfamily
MPVVEGLMPHQFDTTPGEQGSRATEDFLRLYSTHQKHVYAFIGTFFRDAADIDDVLQETSVVLWSKFGEFRPDGNFLQWAFGIARLEVLRHVRKRKGSGFQFDEQLIEMLADERCEQHHDLDRRREALTVCLDKLSRQDRALIEDCYRPGMMIKDVAERLCRPVNAVYQSLSRIRRRLHECASRAIAIREG